MKKIFIIGAVFGVFASVFGLFVGLQLSPVLANILLFPLFIMGKILNQPLGNWSVFSRIIGLLFSMLMWGMVFVGVAKIIRTIKS